MLLNKVDIKTACAAYSGWLSYSKANNALFLDVGNELAINNPWATVPSKPSMRMIRKAMDGESIKRPAKLRISGSGKCVIFK